jgi:hypothetical protein
LNKLYSLIESAEILQVSLRTLWLWIDKAKIEPKRDDKDQRRRLLTWDEIQHLAETHGRTGVLPLPASIQPYATNASSTIKVGTPNRRSSRTAWGALAHADFGRGTAEMDDLLNETFVETPLWRDLISGRVDVVYGAKGAGKSALYLTLLRRQEVLRRSGVILIGAEDPSVDPVFRNLSEGLILEGALSEDQLVALWKVYFLSLIGQQLRTLKLKDRSARTLISLLQDEKLLPREKEPSLMTSIFQAALRYVRGEIGGPTGQPALFPVALTGKITLHEPTYVQREEGVTSLHALFQKAADALERAHLAVWLLVDRLDIAFSSSDEALEAKALRALFRTYIELNASTHGKVLRVKLFLRDDIRRRLTTHEDGRGGTIPLSVWRLRRLTTHEDGSPGIHAFSSVHGSVITWSDMALMDLVAQRILYNKGLREFYRMDLAKGRRDFRQRQALVLRIFPPSVNEDGELLATFNWLLMKLRDGTGQVAPRELILFLTFAREAQLDRLDVGAAMLPDEALFETEALARAAVRVSEFRLFQTFYAEHPQFSTWVENLRGRQSTFTLEGLAQAWSVPLEEARRIAAQLEHHGFFMRRIATEEQTWHVPPLYQSALNLLP